MLERHPDVQARAALVQAHAARRRSAKTGRIRANSAATDTRLNGAVADYNALVMGRSNP